MRLAVTGLVHQMHVPILLNVEVFMLPAFSMETMLRVITEQKIKELLLVPPIVLLMVNDPITHKYDLSHLANISSGAAPLSGEVLQQLQAKFPHIGFKQGYGMTESCSCITAHPHDKTSFEYAARAGAIVAKTEVKVVDVDSGRELDYDEPGEILARGPQVVMGYLNNEKATRETFESGGWLHTGDVGYVDREHFITITDRIKEMIKVKGIGISPAELEDLLLGHPAIADTAVTPIPEKYSGERPKAFVVVNPDLQKTLNETKLTQLGEEILKYVQDKKVRHKWLAEVEFVNQVPKSASGKILRRVLRDNASKGLVVREPSRAKL